MMRLKKTMSKSRTMRVLPTLPLLRSSWVMDAVLDAFEHKLFSTI